MSEPIEFKVGETYSNRLMQYTVLAVQGNRLQVRLDDGTSTTLDANIQRRIISNMIEELDSLTQDAGPASTETHRRFMSSIGFLAAKADLQAEVPSHAQASFERRYREIKGRSISPDAPGYFQLGEVGASKWGPELRVYFRATDAQVNELYFGENVDIKSGTQSGQYRINNNAFFYRLLGLGFDMGPHQSIDIIRERIPISLGGEFNRGVGS